MQGIKEASSCPHMLCIKIAVATHKKYRMPQDPVYLPLHVGAALGEPLGYQADNTGENISELNPYFCELTGLYWMWKNLKADYKGLVHYRRHFCLRWKGSKWASVLTGAEAEALCSKYDVIAPSKRRYVIETLESHYSHTHYQDHLEKVEQIIRTSHPEYLEAFSKTLDKTNGHMFNMFIMRSDLVDEYCTFLFDVLFKLSEQVDSSGYTPFQARYLGRMGELLFNVWLSHKRETESLKIKEIKCIHMERVNWFKKTANFLKAKFNSEKYSESL